MKSKYFILIIFAIISFRCIHHSISDVPNHKTIRIKGSDSMLLLAQRMSEEFMKLHGDVSIYVDGGGSGSGIQALLDGTIDMCTSSRPMSSAEIRQLSSRYGSIGISILCAKDALGIIVHPSNTLSNISFTDITKIFTGKINNWKEIGGTDRPIAVYSREPNSGTYVYLDEHVLLGEKYLDRCIMVPGARALIDAVLRDSSAIGYSTNVYAGNVKILSVNGIPATPENIRNGSYPISRYLYLYTVQNPEGAKKEFVDWIIGKEGQKIIKANGYIPLYDSE